MAETPTPRQPSGALAPVVEKFAVPFLWMAAGFILAKLTGGKKSSAA